MTASVLAKLATFDACVERMRKKGVTHWGSSPAGDLVLGAAPIVATKAEPDPKADRRTYYAEVLGRSVTDAELEKLP